MAKKTTSSSKWIKALDQFGVSILKKDESETFPYIIPFKHVALNCILGGGILGGTLFEIAAPSGLGKSFLLYEAGAKTLEMGGYFFLNDSEEAYKQSYGNKIGLIPDGQHFALTSINSMEDAFKAMRAYVLYVREEIGDKDAPILLGVDSYAGLRINLDLKNEEALKDPIGYMAMQTNMKFNELIAKFIPFIKKHSATMVLINQLTAKYTNGPNGTVKTYQSLNEDKIAYFSTQRIRGEAGKIDGAYKKIVKTVPSLSKYKDEVKKQIGMWVTWETLKNRKIEPFQKAETRILYRSGLKEFSGLSELLANRELIKMGTQVAHNAKGEKLKTPNVGFKLVDDKFKDEFYLIGRKKENLSNKDIERAIKELVEVHPELLDYNKYEFNSELDDE